MTEIDEELSQKKIHKENKTTVKIALAAISCSLASLCALLNCYKGIEKRRVMIGLKIVPRHNAEFFESGYDAWLEQNPHIVSYTPTVPQYFYDNEFEVVSAGYLYNGKQEIIESYEVEEDMVSSGGTPIWYGTLNPNGEIIYFRVEDVRAYVYPKEKQKTKNLARN